MRALRRTVDILAANLHDLIERFEDPAAMLRQAVREMEAALDKALQGAARSLAVERGLDKELAFNEEGAAARREAAAAAVAAGDDALARRHLRRKHEHERIAAALGKERVILAERNQRLRIEVDALRAKLAEAKRAMAALAARRQVVTARRRLRRGETAIEGEGAARFAQLRERIEREEAEADALAELEREGGEPRDEQGRTEDEGQIDVELSMLKAKRAAAAER